MMISSPKSASKMNELEAATAVEAAERRSKEIPVQHWQSVIADHSGVESSPWVYDGRPVVRNTRIPVSVIVGYLTLGAGRNQLLKDYPDLNDSMLKEAVDFVLGLLDG